MNNLLQTLINGVETATDARAGRYAMASVIGTVAGLFFIAAVKLILTAAAMILSHVS